MAPEPKFPLRGEIDAPVALAMTHLHNALAWSETNYSACRHQIHDSLEQAVVELDKARSVVRRLRKVMADG